MALFKIQRGDSSRISTSTTPFHDGYCYFTTDDGGFYIDAENADGTQKRYLVNPKSSQHQSTLLASAWSSNTQTISVPWMGADQNGIIGLDGDISDELMEEIKEADLRIAGQSEGTLTIEVCGTQPTNDIPVVVITFA